MGYHGLYISIGIIIGIISIIIGIINHGPKLRNTTWYSCGNAGDHPFPLQKSQLRVVDGIGKVSPEDMSLEGPQPRNDRQTSRPSKVVSPWSWQTVVPIVATVACSMMLIVHHGRRQRTKHSTAGSWFLKHLLEHTPRLSGTCRYTLHIPRKIPRDSRILVGWFSAQINLHFFTLVASCGYGSEPYTPMVGY